MFEVMTMPRHLVSYESLTQSDLNFWFENRVVLINVCLVFSVWLACKIMIVCINPLRFVPGESKKKNPKCLTSR